MIDERSPRPGLRISSKVTSKLQVTIPKAVADAYGIRPGDEITWVAAGPSLAVVPPRSATAVRLSAEQRLELFGQQQERIRALGDERRVESDDPRVRRGWSREDLYADRGLPRRH